jgi:hypothetical protein
MQRPSALGLLLRDQVIIDRDSGKPTIVGVFTGMVCSQFPSTPRSFDVFAALTDGQGRITLDLVVSRMASEEPIGVISMEQHFPDPLEVVFVRFRFRALSFSAAGQYLFELYADGELICHNRLRARPSEEES